MSVRRFGVIAPTVAGCLLKHPAGRRRLNPSWEHFYGVKNKHWGGVGRSGGRGGVKGVRRLRTHCVFFFLVFFWPLLICNHSLKDTFQERCKKKKKKEVTADTASYTRDRVDVRQRYIMNGQHTAKFS